MMYFVLGYIIIKDYLKLNKRDKFKKRDLRYYILLKLFNRKY